MPNAFEICEIKNQTVEKNVVPNSFSPNLSSLLCTETVDLNAVADRYKFELTDFRYSYIPFNLGYFESLCCCDYLKLICITLCSCLA